MLPRRLLIMSLNQILRRNSVGQRSLRCGCSQINALLMILPWLQTYRLVLKTRIVILRELIPERWSIIIMLLCKERGSLATSAVATLDAILYHTVWVSVVWERPIVLAYVLNESTCCSFDIRWLDYAHRFWDELKANLIHRNWNMIWWEVNLHKNLVKDFHKVSLRDGFPQHVVYCRLNSHVADTSKDRPRGLSRRLYLGYTDFEDQIWLTLEGHELELSLFLEFLNVFKDHSRVVLIEKQYPLVRVLDLLDQRRWLD